MAFWLFSFESFDVLRLRVDEQHRAIGRYDDARVLDWRKKLHDEILRQKCCRRGGETWGRKAANGEEERRALQANRWAEPNTPKQRCHIHRRRGSGSRHYNWMPSSARRQCGHFDPPMNLIPDSASRLTPPSMRSAIFSSGRRRVCRRPPRPQRGAFRERSTSMSSVMHRRW